MTDEIASEGKAWRTYEAACAREMQMQGKASSGGIVPTAATIAAWQAWCAAYERRHGIVRRP